MGVDIVWLRDDFRLDDQPAIAAAAERPALYAYVHDKLAGNGRSPGGAAKWRLAQSLAAMEKRVVERGARLDVLQGPADRTILALAAAADATRVLWTRRYESAATALDAGVKGALRERGVEGLSFNGRLMREPWELARADGAPAATFSAFWRRHRRSARFPRRCPAPARLNAAPWPAQAPERVPVEALRLTPTAPDWSAELALGETPGEQGGVRRWRILPRRDCVFTRATASCSRSRRSPASPPICASARFPPAAPRPPWKRPRRAIPASPRPRRKYLAELGWRGLRRGAPRRPSRHGGASPCDGRSSAFRAAKSAPLRAWARADRLSDGRRRHAPALADRLDA